MNASKPAGGPLTSEAASGEPAPRPSDAAGPLPRALRYLDLGAEIVVAVALAGELVVLFGNLVARELFGAGILWSQEVAQVALATTAFVGGALAYRKGSHIAFTVIRARMSATSATAACALIDFLVAVAAALIGVLSLPILRSSLSAHTPILGMAETTYLAPLTVGMALLTVYAVLRLVTYRGRAAWATVAAAAVVLVVVAAMTLVGVHLSPGWALLVAALAGVALLLVGVPIGFVFVLVAVGFLALSGAAPVEQAAISVGYEIDSFVLLPIPFFVLAGYLMTEGGLSHRIVRLAGAVVGRLPGGLLQVCVVSSFVFSGLTGAKTADVAAVGTAMNTEMRRHGYDPAETASVLSASAAMGEMVPPSTAMLILGSVSTVSIGALFVAGVVPAVLTGLLLMLAVYLRARRRSARTGSTAPEAPVRSRRAEIGRAAAAGVPALVVPVILLGGILSGAATPTESSSLAVVYALVVVAVIKKRGTWAVVRKTLADTAAMAGVVLFIVSAATAVSWCVTVAGVPAALGDLVSSTAGGTATFLLLSLITLIIMGAALEGLPAITLLGPLFMPIAADLGINTLQYGVFMIAAMGIGTFLPPIGVGAYVASAVCDVPIERMIRPYLAYTGALVIAVLITGFIPDVSLFLPGVFGLV